ncbi:MAG: hypothetical protein ABL857_08850, partial [Rickettsiales bacterium]
EQYNDCVEQVMNQIATRELEANVHYALNLYKTTDKYQFTVALEDILRKMVLMTGAEKYSGTIIQLAAQAMDSDNQLVKDNSKHNNYMLDKITALVWYNDGHYENAEKKYREALSNIQYMDFPSEEEKDIAIASIYDSLSGVDDKKAEYIKLIINQNVAVAMGGNIQNGYRHMICFAYYKLKNYAEAVKQCTIQIDNGGDLKARYWRASSYTKLGKSDEALKDFAIVADSENDLRASSAIEMSVIYAKRNDLRNMLASLNNHRYLFDEGSQSKSELAVNYNNRCYAYMKLGELQKALADCTASLKYGNLPDAYQKQQEIIKKINSQNNKV